MVGNLRKMHCKGINFTDFLLHCKNAISKANFFAAHTVSWQTLVPPQERSPKANEEFFKVNLDFKIKLKSIQISMQSFFFCLQLFKELFNCNKFGTVGKIYKRTIFCISFCP